MFFQIVLSCTVLPIPMGQISLSRSSAGSGADNLGRGSESGIFLVQNKFFDEVLYYKMNFSELKKIML